MGFSICWRLTLSDALDRRAVCELMTALRERCLDLPFDKVSSLRDFHGSSLEQERVKSYVWGDYHFNLNVDERGLGTPASKEDCSGPLVTAPATEMVEFVVWPGRGCETAHFVVARIAREISWTNPDRPDLGPQRIDVPRPADQWYGLGASKTQYSALPERGGTNHFLKCHLGLIAAIEEARSLDFGVEVTDDGDYWKSRDPMKLLRELHEWNQKVARIVGGFKDALEGQTDGTFIAPITARPDFEHLEAGGGNLPLPDLNDLVVADLLRRTKAIYDQS